MAEPVPLKVTLNNRTARIISDYPKEFSDLFSFRPDGYFWSPLYKQGVWDGRLRLIKNHRLAAGLFLEMRREAESKGFRFKIDDYRKGPRFRLKEPESNREFQVECMEALVENSNCGGIVLCATGTGKTHIAGMYFRKLMGAGLFVVDELMLMQQAAADIEEVIGEKVGLVGDKKFQPERITVATVQTLQKHRNDPRFREWQRNVEVMFIDEIHQQLNKRSKEVIQSFNPLAVFGLTATLQMEKPKVRMEATALAGPVIYRYPIAQGVADKHLTPGIVIGLDLYRQSHVDAYTTQDLYDLHVVKSKARNQMVEDLVVEAVRRRYSVMVLVDRVEHIRRLRKRFERQGLSVGLMYGKIKAKDRIQAKENIERSRIDVVLANRVAKKGISMNIVDVIIDNADMRSQNDAVQKYGRGTRLCNGKKGLIYIDVGERVQYGKINNLQSRARSRRRAFKKIDIPVFAHRFTAADTVFDFAEKKLKRYLNKLRKAV